MKTIFIILTLISALVYASVEVLFRYNNELKYFTDLNENV